jgi:hypothetical protein
MEIGYAKIIINAIGEADEKIEGTAEILNTDGKTVNPHGTAGIILLEKGNAIREIKAGQAVYVKINARDTGYEDYYTSPLMIWPNKTYTFNAKLYKQISNAEIAYEDKIYNETDSSVQTLAPGKKYYAKFKINSDKEYNEVIFNFRAGKETNMENDVIEIDAVESAGITTETRGTTYNEEKGYSFDAENITDGLAKWSTIMWKNFGKGTREVKIWFRVKKTAPQNKEVQFYYKAIFDGTRVPESTAEEDFYADPYSTRLYYIGSEAECTEGICYNSEWLYSKKDELYIDSPFTIKQTIPYGYHFVLLNNTEIDYGTETKPIYLTIKVLGDEQEEKRIKINNYEIKDSIGKKVNNVEVYSAENIQINSFEKNQTIDSTMEIQGIKTGAEIIRIELKSEGKIIYTKDVSIEIVQEKEMVVSISPQFIPALINTQIEVNVLDPKGEYLAGVTAKTFAKEPGYEQYLIDESETDRVGRALVDSGAMFPNTKIILELTKEGYARKTYSISVSEEAIIAEPSQVLVELNTYTQREQTIPIIFANLTQQDLIIKNISMDSKFKDTINEDALLAYLQGIADEEKTLKGEDTLDIDLLKIRLANSITNNSFIEPVTVEGKIYIVFEQPNTHVQFTVELPTTINISSDANPGESCLLLKTNKTKYVTEQGQVLMDFELQNACTSNGVPLELDALSVSSPGEIPGIAQVQVTSATGAKTGYSALDGGNRIILANIAPNEKLYGSVAFAPDEQTIGKTVNLQISFQAKFNSQTINSNPSSLTFTISVINLKECMSISSDAGPTAFTEKAKVIVDSTACLGQKIDVILCKDDSGCSGGADGKISLSKKSFTIQDKAEEIEAYAPTYPGTYGISVYARVRGLAGFNDIGEVTVSFSEQDTKFFNLNKTELNLIGEGSQDYVILTNKMLQQNVAVKANGCVWGAKDPGKDWMKVIGGAALGAALGNMIGSGFKTEHPSTEQGQGNASNPNGEPNYEGLSQAEKTEAVQAGEDSKKILNSSENNFSVDVQSLDGEKLGFGSKSIADTDTLKYFPTDSDGVPLDQPYQVVNAYNDTIIIDRQQYAITKTETFTGSGTPTGTTYRYHNLDTGKDFYYSSAQTINTAKMSSVFAADAMQYQQSFGGKLDYYSAFGGVGTFFKSPSAGYSWYNQGGYENPADRTTTEPVTDPHAWQPIQQAPLEEINLEKISFSGISFPGLGWVAPENEKPKASFTGWVGHQQGWFTLFGAVAGGMLAYMSQDFDCDDEQYDQVVEYQDYVIFLEGEEITVMSPNGEKQEERTIPSDAGALDFTLGEIQSEWDFTDASVSDVEEVAIKFTNTGLNDAKASYGTLTINANKHEHGKNASLGTTSEIATTGTGEEYDVICKKPTFGNYWIDEGEDAGECGVIKNGTYSQKYHLRVVSGEPSEENAYIKKATTCYSGALTGSTGPEAVPRVKLDWQWDNINEDTCDYTNQNFVYCDATQFTIALVKKLAHLDEYLQANGNSFSCPPDLLEQSVQASINEINNESRTISQGVIGIKEVQMNLDDEKATPVVVVQNNTGGEVTSYMTYSWKGEGKPSVSNPPKQWNIVPGETRVTLDTIDVPKSDTVYYFTAVMNGEKGDRLPFTRAFLNKEQTNDCWLEQTTRQTGGMPSLMYYMANIDEPATTTAIGDETELYNTINYGAYLTKDAFTQDFFRDFKDYYLNQVFTGLSVEPREKQIVEYLDSGNFTISKKFTGSNEIEPGLYDVYINLDAPNLFKVIDENNTKIEITLLLVKKPTVDSPFYNTPFDGVLGEQGGRQGYGTIYKVENTDNRFIITNEGDEVTAKESAASNGVTTLTINMKTSFDTLNSSVGTRGQIAAINSTGRTATMSFTPNYATPIILKYTLQGNSGNLAFGVENNRQATAKGSNITYWTGAAKSKDFYGGNAVETYNNSPDNHLTKLGEDVYGFEYHETSRSGTMYLKTTMFVPVENSQYVLTKKADGTSFWTPNTDFLSNVPLDGIDGMKYNSKKNNSYTKTLDDLFNAVKESKVCVSSDGSSSSFWWNPAVLENTTGSSDNQAKKELGLVGSN